VLDVFSRAGLYNRVQKLWIRSFKIQGYDLSATPPFTKGVHGLGTRNSRAARVG